MANSQQSAMQQNLMARNMLLATGVPMKKRLALSGPYSLGQTIQINLDRVGVLTALEVEVVADVTIADAPATPSEFGAYALLNKIKYTDFNGVDRVNTDGTSLFALNSQRGGWLYDQAIGSPSVPGFATAGTVDSDQYRLPTAIGSENLLCNFIVPLAYNPRSDLRGAILAQTVVGDHKLQLTFANQATGDSFNAPYKSGNVTISNIYVRVYEWYIQPASLDTLPHIDLSTIYGIEGGMTSSDNFAAGGQKFINFPNNRSVMASYHVVMNNGAPINNADLTGVTLIANSNTNLREETVQSLRRSARQNNGGDLPRGIIVIDTRHAPIATTMYGNVQARFDIASGTVLSSPYIATTFEDLYPAGVPLPGVAAGY